MNFEQKKFIATVGIGVGYGIILTMSYGLISTPNVSLPTTLIITGAFLMSTSLLILKIRQIGDST